MKRFLILSIFLMLVMLNSNSIWAKQLENSYSKKVIKQNSATSKRENTFTPGKQKFEDAKKNLGQIKKNFEENPENYPEFEGMNTKEIKNRITSEKMKNTNNPWKSWLYKKKELKIFQWKKS